jgi:ribosomal protein S18 acetylase RimI-like enzyme
MPEIEIRPAIANDIPALTALEHNYTSDHVWQVDVQSDETQVQVIFRETRLPRSVRVEYPHPNHKLAEDWNKRSALFVAILESLPIGYISLRDDIAPSTTWIDDLVVMRRLRRQGIGTALLLAAQNWASQHSHRRVVMEMQSKNHPAICLAQKLGFDFSGYNERYYSNMDITLFFTKIIA